jgi:hypothetical protein
MRKIPIFYHIPKNAGTYTISYFIKFFEYWRDNYTDWNDYSVEGFSNIKFVCLVKDNRILARLLLGDLNQFLDQYLGNITQQSESEFKIDLDEVTSEFLNNFFVFAVIIQSEGFKYRSTLLAHLANFSFYEFMILRESFSRVRSLYAYAVSEESVHESIHFLLKSESLEKYILLDECEDCWLIRNILGLDDIIEIEQFHFDAAVDILQTFNVYDIKRVDRAIKNSILSCYDIDVEQLNLSFDNIFRNQSNTFVNIEYSNLCAEAQEHFKQRSFWDRKLYSTLLEYK